MEDDKSTRSQQWMEILGNVRRICGSLPEAEEIIDGHGHNTFKVKGKTFIMMGEHLEITYLSFKSDRENQEVLLHHDRFNKTPYVGQHGWVSTNSNHPLHWDELTELFKEAYLRAAPNRLVKQLMLKD